MMELVKVQEIVQINELPKSIMRYSLLHAQLVNIIIPCNPNLTVGNCIRLNIENITQDNKIEKEV